MKCLLEIYTVYFMIFVIMCTQHKLHIRIKMQWNIMELTPHLVGCLTKMHVLFKNCTEYNILLH